MIAHVTRNQKHNTNDKTDIWKLTERSTRPQWPMSTPFSKSFKGQIEGHRDIPIVSEGKSVNLSHTMIDSGRMEKKWIFIFSLY